MPSKNTIKTYLSNQHYHAYNRGWNRTEIFCDQSDYHKFESLLAGALSAKAAIDLKGRQRKHFKDIIDLNAYCLMPNHFHLLVYQRDERAAAKLLQSICTAYTMYFNKKYKRRGPLFENRFKAVLIVGDTQLLHISRYIHLNHSHYKIWPHSSYGDYINGIAHEWVTKEPIMQLFDSAEQYAKFVDDYAQIQRENDRLKLLQHI